MKAAAHHHPPAARESHASDYLPLGVVLVLALLCATVRQLGRGAGWDGVSWMHDFMGLWLVVFAMFKFFDLSGFADGFHMYDLLARRFRAYGYVYPFIECGLGLGYLAQWNLPVVYGTTIVVMGFGAIGVLRALRRGLDLQCACMGTVLKVPLSTVALTENLSMVAMAAAMWLMQSN